jgi:hypothetical protein
MSSKYYTASRLLAVLALVTFALTTVAATQPYGPAEAVPA